MPYLIVFFAIIAFLGLMLFLIIDKENLQNEQTEKQIKQQFNAAHFNIGNYHTPIPRIGNGIVLDIENKRIGIVALPSGKLSIYDISQIVALNMEHKYSIVQTTSSKKGVNVGRAVVGSVLFGGVGAVIGGVSGKSKEITINNEFYVESIITLNTKQIYNPIIKVNLNIKDRAERVVAQINLMMNN